MGHQTNHKTNGFISYKLNSMFYQPHDSNMEFRSFDSKHYVNAWYLNKNVCFCFSEFHGSST